jgi:mevalonate kinase
MKSFKTQTFGKWILAGEHAVLRGHPALAFPLITKSLDLSFQPSNEPLSVQFGGERGGELNLLFYGVLENALSRLHVSEALKGHFHLSSTLPVGAGLGASAALCGAVGRWCEGQGWISQDQVYEFSRSLEDLFHGESSGVDVAVSLSGQGVRFIRGGERRSISPKWWPKFFLSYSGQRGMTSECVRQVKDLFALDRPRAEKLDLQMHQAVNYAEAALLDPSANAWEKLKMAIDMAGECFLAWGLCKDDLFGHIQSLRAAGAAAAKPTGSGGGGYVLSLWNEDPPKGWRDRLVLVPQPES